MNLIVDMCALTTCYSVQEVKDSAINWLETASVGKCKWRFTYVEK